MKYKARKLSKTILTINKGTKVDCFYTTSKGRDNRKRENI